MFSPRRAAEAKMYHKFVVSQKYFCPKKDLIHEIEAFMEFTHTDSPYPQG